MEALPIIDSVLAPTVSSEDRLRLRDAIHRLMAHGSILRDEAGQREIYDWCRTRTQWLDEIADLLGFRLAWEHDNRLIQAIPQFPALLRRLRLDESLIAMALWYPVIVAAITFVIGTLLIRETKDHKIQTI